VVAAYWRDAGGTVCLLLMRLLCVNAKFLAGAGVVVERVFWCALGALCFLFVRSLLGIDGTTNKNALGEGVFALLGGKQAQMLFGVGFKVGAAANVFLIEENLRYGFNRFTDGFFQIGFGDAFRVDIHVAEVEIIALFGQFFSQLFRAHTVRAPWTTKNYCKHFSLLKKQA
jgi:hypothetical protein